MSHYNELKFQLDRNTEYCVGRNRLPNLSLITLLRWILGTINHPIFFLNKIAKKSTCGCAVVLNEI